jgi:quercetin dioxygenase-like cupin family protein
MIDIGRLCGVSLGAAGILLALLAAAPTAPAPSGATAKVFEEAIPNLQGKTMTAVVVDYPPGGGSPPHRHAGSGFIFAYVLSGAIRSQLEGQPVAVYQTGQSWSEPPGAHHVVSENASATEPARLLAVFVADTGAVLTTFGR